MPAHVTKIRQDDPAYRATMDKRFNKRFVATPDYIVLADSTEAVVAAVEEAIRQGERLAVTSGGHCLENFVSDHQVRVIIDVSPLRSIRYDSNRVAISVEAGATVGETFKTLSDRWGVVIPLGEYPAIGMGGHVVGGAFGFLCRQLGLAADYLDAVEVVTVDAAGRASATIGTRDPQDPNHDLWWAHTGGGGGNFGIVTRYWFRSPVVKGEDPAFLLPKAPESVTTFKVEWNWRDVDRDMFRRLLTNHGRWGERESGADSRFASLWTLFEVHRKQFGRIVMRGVSTAADAESQMNEYLGAITEGVRAPHGREVARMAWLEFALSPLPDLFASPPGGVSVKVKDAMLRKRFTDEQMLVIYDYLTRDDHDIMGGMLGLATYGGRVNSVTANATASSQRNAIFDMACTTGWVDPGDEARNLAWVRSFYRDLFKGTGGVPVPGDAYDGAFINHPDSDLADEAWNKSGVPWSTLYYQENYPRLQRIKARWDPLNVFHHALSVEAT